MLDAKANAPVYFASLIGVSSIPVTAHAVIRGTQSEISLALDNSYSMY